ncbi:MAG: hypothetical protein H7831_14680 [Magnetococcus sp. WYHC-3]
MTKRNIVILSLISLAIGGAIGYFFTPTRTVTKVEVKEVVKVVKETQKDKKNDKIVIVVETVLPDGTKKKETKIVDKGTITIRSDETSEKQVETKTEKVVEKEHDSLMIYAFGNTNVFNPSLEYGLGVQKRVVGPFWLGAFGSNKVNIGLTLGISF